MHAVSLSPLSQSMFSAPALNTSARVDRLNITEDAHGSLRVRKAHRRPKRYSNGRTRASKKRNRARARYGRVQTRRSRPASLSSTSSRRSDRAASIQRSPPTCTRAAIMKIDDRGVFHFSFSPTTDTRNDTAKLAISIARKMNALIFLVPEDIVDARPRSVCLLFFLMSVNPNLPFCLWNRFQRLLEA